MYAIGYHPIHACYRFTVPCFSMVMDCIRIKGLTKKSYLVILSRSKIRNISLRFIVFCIIIQEVKGLTKLYFVLLSRTKTSFFAKFRVHCSHCLPVFTWLWLHYNVLSALHVSVKQG